jgi:hypothetical protein
MPFSFSTFFSRSGAALAAAALLLPASSAGATTRVEAVKDHLKGSAAPAPGVVLVYDFDADPERVEVALPTFELLTGGSVGAGQRAAAGRRAASGLAHALFESLRRRGAPVRRAAPETPVPDRALLVKGRFLSVDEGGGQPSGGLGGLAGLAGLGSGAVRVRVQFDAYQKRPSAARLLWQGRVVTESAPSETGLLAQGAVAEAAGRLGGAQGEPSPAAQRARAIVRRYTVESAEAITGALWQRFSEAGWLVAER